MSASIETSESLPKRSPIRECVSADSRFIRCDINATDVMSKLRSFGFAYFGERDHNRRSVMMSRFSNYFASIAIEVCETLNRVVLSSEPRVVRISSPSFVLGDIHGNLKDLYDYEKSLWFSQKASTKSANFTFLGDFVDRGAYSCECSIYLFVLKLLSPKNVILIRGNHEVRDVNRKYTFYKECLAKYGPRNGWRVWDAINSSFELLPIVAVIDDIVFCCHGGIPKSTSRMENIMNIPKPLVNPLYESMTAHELLWNDPAESMRTYDSQLAHEMRTTKVDFIPNRIRSTGYYFTESAVDQFFATNKLTFMIRAHESVPNGYRYHFNYKAVTVFSSSNYCGRQNRTAVIQVMPEEITPILLKESQKSQTSDDWLTTHMSQTG